MPADPPAPAGPPDQGGLGAPGAAITVDGRRLPVRPGQTIAAVLIAAGWRTFRVSRLRGRPRGLFCGIGVCHDCLVTVNGQPGVRACLEPAAGGDVVRTDRPA
jgi:predicted molibdopterin-dependent oxidoreductase YjgC